MFSLRLISVDLHCPCTTQQSAAHISSFISPVMTEPPQNAERYFEVKTVVPSSFHHPSSGPSSTSLHEGSIKQVYIIKITKNFPHQKYSVESDYNITTILAFISGASFISLIIILVLFLIYKNKRNRDEDDISNSSIIYNIEQDSVNFSPALEKHINNILMHEDMTGLLGPSLAALKCAHAITTEMTSTGKLVLTNIKHLEMVKKNIRQLPALSDQAIQVIDWFNF